MEIYRMLSSDCGNMPVYDARTAIATNLGFMIYGIPSRSTDLQNGIAKAPTYNDWCITSPFTLGMPAWPIPKFT
jgi:hypothetical protein